jgi:hypothetical protein
MKGKPFILHPASVTGPGSTGSSSNSGSSVSNSETSGSGTATTSTFTASPSSGLDTSPSEPRVSKWQHSHANQRQKLANSITTATAEFIRTKKVPSAAWVERWENECLQVTSQAIVAEGMGLWRSSDQNDGVSTSPATFISDAEVQDFLQILWSLSQLCGLEGEGIHVSEEVLASLYDWVLLNLLRRGVDESGAESSSLSSLSASGGSESDGSDILPSHPHAANLYHALLSLARTSASRIGAPGTHEAQLRDKAKNDIQKMRGKIRVVGNEDDVGSTSYNSSSRGDDGTNHSLADGKTATSNSSSASSDSSPSNRRPPTTSSLWLGRQIKFFVREWETSTSPSLDMFSSKHMSGTLAALGMLQELLTSVQVRETIDYDTI